MKYCNICGTRISSRENSVCPDCHYQGYSNSDEYEMNELLKYIEDHKE